jgi:hypothetical protein
MKFVGEVDTRDEPERSIYPASELAVLAFLLDKIQKYSTRQIRDFSHQEKGIEILQMAKSFPTSMLRRSKFSITWLG